MKRKVETRDRWIHRVTDPRKALPAEQLAALGACTLAYNDLEATVDVLTCVVSRIPALVWRDVVTRINGMDGKFAIIKAACADVAMIRGGTAMGLQVADTITAVGSCKGYRDTLIHARIIGRDATIGEMTIRRGEAQEVYLSTSALNALYNLMLATTKEVQALVSFFLAFDAFRGLTKEGAAIDHIRVDNEMARLQAIRSGLPGIVTVGAALAAKPIDWQSVGQECRDAMSRYHEYQRQRRSLPPLPSFPTEVQGPLNQAMLMSNLIGPQTGPNQGGAPNQPIPPLDPRPGSAE